jgi:hypothetical protein
MKQIDVIENLAEKQLAVRNLKVQRSMISNYA